MIFITLLHYLYIIARLIYLLNLNHKVKINYLPYLFLYIYITLYVPKFSLCDNSIISEISEEILEEKKPDDTDTIIKYFLIVFGITLIIISAYVFFNNDGFNNDDNFDNNYYDNNNYNSDGTNNNINSDSLLEKSIDITNKNISKILDNKTNIDLVNTTTSSFIKQPPGPSAQKLIDIYKDTHMEYRYITNPVLKGVQNWQYVLVKNEFRPDISNYNKFAPLNKK